MKIKLTLLFLILIFFTFDFRSAASPVNQDAPPDICQQSENIMPNCNFDNGTSGWTPFLEEGSAEFAVLQGGGECHAPLCPAGYIVTQSHFVGGIYQQVKVTPGNTYYANIVWLVFDSFANDNSINSVVGGISRKIGIDPFGGTDPKSGNIVWGPENTRNDCKICASQEATATAQADTITVFLRIDDRWRQRAAEKGYNVPPSKDQFWLDDFGLKQVGGSAAPPPPTDTPVPPTPVPPPPTDTPVPEIPTEAPPPAEPETVPAQLANAAPTEEIAQAEVEPTSEAVAPTDTPTPVPVTPLAPPPTLTPSATPSPTATFEPKERPQPTATRVRRTTQATVGDTILPTEIMGMAAPTLCLGGGLVGLMGAVLVGLVGLYRLGWSKADDDDPDEPAEIVINLPKDDYK